MSMSASSPHDREAHLSPPSRGVPRRQRRALSCLPCRLYKIRCNRVVPCQNCCRYNREEQCRLNPPPAARMPVSRSYGASSMLPTPVREVTMEPSPPKCDGSHFPPSPSSMIAREPDNTVQPSPQTSTEQHQDPQGQYNGDKPRHDDVSDQRENVFEIVPAFANNTTVASAVVSRSRDIPDRTLLDEPASYWRLYLISVLPTQTQCDMLISYFLENINWVYQAIHVPTFRADYAQFWTTDVSDVNLIWLALLYTMMCLGALFIPSQMAEAGGFDAADLPQLHRRWYAASRQALNAGGYDSKPTLTQIQVFLISQLYWYHTKSIEVLNSHMGQAIRNAQAMGLDKEAPITGMNCLEREMRHRVWWDLVSSDTFQSICLGRPPLLQSRLSTVPFPANCNDVDITPSAIHVRPISEPTEMSVHCFRARIFRLLNMLYVDNGAHLTSYSYVVEIDSKITQIMDEYPWYLKESPDVLRSRMSHGSFNTITWMRHILHSCICVQRVRMYRPFLNPLVGDSWERCVSESTAALAVYKALRSPDIPRFQRSQKMHVQAYQVFSAAVALATFLLVEMPSNAEYIRADIEMILEDLEAHNSSVDKTRSVPLISDGWQVIKRILNLYDSRRKFSERAYRARDDALRATPPIHQDDGPSELVPAIFSVFGGESSARRYLQRCTIEYIVSDTASGDAETTPNGSNVTPLDMSSYDGLLNPEFWSLWGDALWADLDSVLGLEPELN